jgi:hypothetical protein
MEFGFNSSSPSGGGGLIYMGAWDALTNSPFLQSGVGNNGEYYIVNVAGSTNLDGITDWEIGDWAVFNGTAWQKIDNSSIGGSGTTNYVSKFTGSATLGNSQIFDNGTNVGIGTTSPNFKLNVETNSDGDGIMLRSATNQVGGIQKSNNGDTAYIALYRSGSNPSLIIGDQTYTGNSWIDDGKNLGIGTQNALAKVHIKSTFNSPSISAFIVENAVNGNYIFNVVSDGEVNISGNLGVGTLTPSSKLQVIGIDSTSSNFALKIDNSTPTTLFSVRNDGVIDVYGTITPRIQSVVSAATVTPTNLNDEVVITAQAAALFFANPTGTAVQGQSMLIRIKDNGTARAITYDTQYRAIGVTLPTTTVINKTVYLGLIYNATDTKWDVIGVAQEV